MNPGELIATTGSMYLYFSTNGGGNDSGFMARWTSVAGTGSPIASMAFPADTLYPVWSIPSSILQKAPVAMLTLSRGINGSSVAFTRDLVWTFDSVGKFSRYP